MPDSAPGVDDHKPDPGTELSDLKVRVTNLENAIADLQPHESATAQTSGDGGPEAAPQLQDPPDGAPSS